MTGLSTPAPEEPDRVGGYRIVRQLGQGSQGIVFLGEFPAGRQVAIKVLHSCFAADSDVRRRFQREAEIAASVATFSTARVLTTGFAEERPYIVSEYVPGPSLEELIRADGPRSGGGLERLAVTTLTALSSIHAAGVVHRDVKPGNVIMAPEGPVMIDFGIALALDATTSITGPMGTPAYMSPEQFTDQALTPAADMFSWAGTMIYAATGQPPFSATTVGAMLNAILNTQPDLSAIPHPLRRLVAACLAKDPADRPQASEALCELIGGDGARRAPAARAGLPSPRHIRPAAVWPQRVAGLWAPRRRRPRTGGRHALRPEPGLAASPVVPGGEDRGDRPRP
ncbi:serine/threonine-protein kinase [Streptosporangium sp. NPDC048865]|uniref:serine/threonine-protein kinase n=1 Tax=Streptosporangium sp. NPDC048865 TaxID=3155766 RepID=UPI003428283B